MGVIIDFPNKEERKFLEIDREIDDSKMPNIPLDLQPKAKEVLKSLARKYPSFPKLQRTTIALNLSEQDSKDLQEWLGEIKAAVEEQVGRMVVEIAVLQLQQGPKI
jgi:hypothetical protein